MIRHQDIGVYQAIMLLADFRYNVLETTIVLMFNKDMAVQWINLLLTTWTRQCQTGQYSLNGKTKDLGSQLMQLRAQSFSIPA